MSSIYGSAAGANVIYGKNNTGVAFGGNGGIPFSDDSDLKAYYKFNETSGNILNSSESDESIGSSAELVVTGATYNDTSSPFGYGMSFDGSNDYAAVASSKSIFNFMHSAAADFSINMCIKYAGEGDDFIFVDNENGEGVRTGSNEANNFRGYTKNASGDDCGNVSVAGFFPSTTTFYFVAMTYDQSSGNWAMWRDGVKIETDAKTGNTPSSNDSANVMNLARRPDGGHYTVLTIAEASIWNRKLTDDEIDELYNDGDGKQIYV